MKKKVLEWNWKWWYWRWRRQTRGERRQNKEPGPAQHSMHGNRYGERPALTKMTCRQNRVCLVVLR